MKDDIKMIPIDQIRILNPRFRDRKKFETIIQSIRNLGLKKPIQISLRPTDEAEGPGYDLVCGQGRIEAFVALGLKEIPATIVEVSKEERLLRSLIENMARRVARPIELMREIERLNAQGYTNAEISQKLDVCDTSVSGFIALSNAKEERLLEAAIGGRIPLGVAMDIARTNSVAAQRELLKAYEAKQLNQVSIRVVKRLIEHRRLLGKQRSPSERCAHKNRTSAESLVNAYKRERQRQKVLIRKAKVCEGKLVFIITAFNKLLANENFSTLLRAESLASMPKDLWRKLSKNSQEGV